MALAESAAICVCAKYWRSVELSALSCVDLSAAVCVVLSAAMSVVVRLDMMVVVSPAT